MLTSLLHKLRQTLPNPLPLSDIALKYDIDIEFWLTEPKLNINVNVREREGVGQQVVKQTCYLSVNIYKEV